MSKSAVIFINGEAAPGEMLSDLVSRSNLILAADGGARLAKGLGFTPQAIIGDCDSLDPEEQEYFLNQGIEFVRFQSDKDQTDLELAMDHAKKLGATEIHLIGAGGGRLDQILGNALLLAHADHSEVEIWLYDASFRATAVRPGKRLNIPTSIGTGLSLLPLSFEVSGVNLSGTHWPLNNQLLRVGSGLTISNRVTEDSVRVSIETGVMLLLLDDVR